jgi:hypothetical protein
MPEAPAGLVAEAEEMAAVEPVAMETVVVDAGPVVVGDAIEVTEPVEADEASVVASAVEESGRDAVAAEEVVEPAKDEEPAAAPFHRWTSVDTVYGQGQAPEAAAEATGVFVPLETAKAEAVRRSFAPSGRSVWDLPSGLAEERRKPARPMASASEHAKMGLQERRRWGLLDRFAEPGSSRPDDVAASGRPGEGRRND